MTRLMVRSGVAQLAPVLLLVTLGLFHLDTKSFWLDETFSAQVALLDPEQFRTLVQTLEPNMGLYYLLLRGWRHFGAGDAWLRTFSVLTASATIVPLIAVGKRLVGRTPAIVGAVLFAANAFVVHHAQEARSYALLLLLTVTATLAFVRLVERPTAGRWTAYVILAALALYAHLFAAWVLVAHAVAWLPPAGRELSRRRLAAAFATIAVLAIPLALWLWATPRRPDWIPPLTKGVIGSFVLEFAGGGGTALVATMGLLVALGMVNCRHHADENGRWALQLLLAWLFVPIVGTVVLSVIAAPALVPRFMLPAVAPFALLAGAGIAGLRPTPLRAVALAATLALASRGLYRWYTRPGEDWRGAVGYILASAKSADAVILEPAWAWPGAAHYLRAAGPGAPRSRFPSTPWHAPDPLSGELGRTYRDWLGDRPPEDRRLWLVERLPGKASAGLVAPWLPVAIAEHYCIRATHVTTRIRVRLVERCR